MRLGVVCVHYHAAPLALQALDAVRSDAESAGFDYELVIVDNGSTDDERDLLSSSGIRVLKPGNNRGYAAGVNQGAEALLPGVDVLIAMNPDVLVQQGCLRALVHEIRAGSGVAGPRFFWDSAGRYQLPPTESCGRRAELLRTLSSTRRGAWAKRGRAAWRRHAYRHWQSDRPLDSHDLSGAMMAISREAWQRVGPFDEDYRLYFEETDWLRRCSRQGIRARFVGSAHAVHLYAQSTPNEPMAQQWFLESQARFRQRHYGSAFVSFLSWIARRSNRRPDEAEDPGKERIVELLDRSEPWCPGSGTCWIEISPSPLGFPAAMREVSAQEPLISDSLWLQMAAGTYYLRAIREDRSEGDRAILVKPVDKSRAG